MLANVWKAIAGVVARLNANDATDRGQKAAIEDHERRIRGLEGEIRKCARTLDADG